MTRIKSFWTRELYCAGVTSPMRQVQLPVPEVGLIAVTRAVLGLGVGLLIASRLSERKRTTVGRIALAIGLLSTFPLVADVLSRRVKQ